jgi:type IV pilus assembly protein PilC
MTTFRYSARTFTGERIDGTLIANDRSSALIDLQLRTLNAFNLVPVRTHAPTRRNFRRTRLSARVQSGFYRSLATLIGSGVPLRRALRVATQNGVGGALESLGQQVISELDQGGSFSRALQQLPALCPPPIGALLTAGEASGNLESTMEHVAHLLERSADVGQRIRASLTYPAIVLFAAATLITFLIVRVVPMFAELFRSFHVEPPTATAAIFFLSAFLAQPAPWIVLSIACVISALGIVVMRRHKRGQIVLAQVVSSLPVLGVFIRKTVWARVANALAAMLRAGIDIDQALNTARTIAYHPLIDAALTRIAAAIRNGEALSAAFAREPLADRLLTALVVAGEESGQLDHALERAARHLDADVTVAIETLASLIEPTLVIGLGAIVAILLATVFLPLYSLIGSVSS